MDEVTKKKMDPKSYVFGFGRRCVSDTYFQSALQCRPHFFRNARQGGFEISHMRTSVDPDVL